MHQKQFDLNEAMHEDSLQDQSRKFLSVAAAIISIVLLTYIVINILVEDYATALLELGTLMLVVIGVSHMYRTKTTTFASNIGAVVLLIVTLQNYTIGGFHNTGILWTYSFPAFVFFFTSRKQGLLWSLLLFIIISGLILLNANKFIDLPYDTFTSVMLLITLGVVSGLSYFHQELIESYQGLDSDRQKRLRQNNVKLAHEITERKFVEGKLKTLLREAQEKNTLLQDTKKAMTNVLEDVEEEKEKLEIILQSIGDGVFVLDKQKVIVLANNTVSQITGYSRKELEGHNYTEKLKFLREKDHHRNTAFIEEVYEKGEVTQMRDRTVVVHKDGKEIAVSDSAAPIKNSRGEVIGCVVVFRDSTKEREIDRMKSEFISVASHQLRTPLTGIKWYIEMLQEGEDVKSLTEQQKEMIASIDNSAKRMITLVNDLLNVSRIETGRKYAIEKKEEDIVKVIKDVVERHEVIAKKKNTKLIVTDHFPKQCPLWFDGAKIHEVVANLVTNAIKYTRPKGEVVIDFAEDEKNVTISVKDNGFGIPKEEQHRIFEKFFRASNVSKRIEEGTGLGLYISKAFVEGHGGKMWFESEENKGTTFFIALPKGKPRKLTEQPNEPTDTK